MGPLWRAAAARRGRSAWSVDRRPTDEGVGLIDVLMAVAILLIVLVPAALVLTSAGSSSGQSEHRLTASSIASSYVDEVQALQGPDAPGGYAPPFTDNTDNSIVYDAYLGDCGGITQCVSFPATPSGDGQTFPNQTVGSLTYSITAAGGYCEEVTQGSGVTEWVEPDSGGTAVLTTYQPAGQPQPTPLPTYAYWIAVKVSWGATGANSEAGDVVQYARLVPTPNENWPDLSKLQGIVPTGVGQTPMCPTSLQP